MTETKKLSKSLDQLAGRLTEGFVRDLVAQGHISKNDLSDRDKLYSAIQNVLNNSKLEIVIDHRESILQAAKTFLSKAHYDFSIIFYAMYFEHAINNLIALQNQRRKISRKTTNELIRSVSVEGKFSWLLELLEMPAFNEHHRRTITTLSNARNAFIHYKWNPAPDTPLGRDNEIALDLIRSASTSVTYMKKYEARVLYEKNKGKISNALRK